MRRKVLIASPSKCPMGTVVRQRMTVTVTITNVDEPGTVTLVPMSGLRVGGTVTATLADDDASPAQIGGCIMAVESRRQSYFW